MPSSLLVHHAKKDYDLTVLPTKLVFQRREGSTSGASLPADLALEKVAFVKATPSAAGAGDPATQVLVVYLEDQPGDFPSVAALAFTTSSNFAAFSAEYAALEALLLAPLQGQTIDVVINGSAGGGRAQSFFLGVEGLLTLADLPFRSHATTGVDDAGRIAREVVEKARKEGRKAVFAVLGGDGTTHELLNGLLLDKAGEFENNSAADLVILPLGTANALYYSLFPPESPSTPCDSPLGLLYSLLAFLRGSHTLPLQVALNTLPGSPSSIITSVVSSAALHASILFDAEELRATIPGVDRFKVAAQKNASTWWRGTLKLLPEESIGVRRYQPTSKTLESIPSDDAWVTIDSSSGYATIKGPFSYLVSSLVSRFESNFVVAPLRSPLSPLAPSSPPSIDIIIIRPSRDVETAKMVAAGQQEEAATAFVAKVWGVMGGMYSGGTHIDVEYADQKLPIVEVFRCGGFVWEPEPSDDVKSNLVCLDGAVRDLGRGGKLSTTALGAEQTGLRVWC